MGSLGVVAFLPVLTLGASAHATNTSPPAGGTTSETVTDGDGDGATTETPAAPDDTTPQPLQVPAPESTSEPAPTSASDAALESDAELADENQPNPTPNDLGLQVSPSAVAPGADFRLTSAISAGPGDNLHFWIRSVDWPDDDAHALSPLELSTETKAGSNGLIDLILQLPAAVAPGTYEISYMCVNGDAVSCSGSIPFTVTGTSPTTRPAGAVLSLTANPLQGRATDPIHVTANCAYNGVAADSAVIYWVYPSATVVARTGELGTLPLVNGGLDHVFQVPADAAPPAMDQAFANQLKVDCRLGAFTIGHSKLTYSVTDGKTTTTQNTQPVLAETGAPADAVHSGAALSALVLAALGALLVVRSHRPAAGR